MSLASEVRSVRRAVLPLLAMVCAVNCARASQDYATTLSGTVVDEKGAPILRASVTLVGTGHTVVTDSTGTFSFSAKDGNPNATIMAVTAEGYAPQYRNYHWDKTDIALGEVQLRTVVMSQEVTLPTSPNEVANVHAVAGDGGAGVSFGYQAFVTPSGAVAEGNATVNLTYWHPQGNLESIPGALVAIDANGPSPLRTFGMLSVDVYQGTDKLQVAPGQTATLAFTTPNNMLAQMLNQTVPNLYWLDPNVGLWRVQSAAGDGNMVLDPNTGIFTARVPHLSEWNMDGSYEFENGGCISGRVYNMCAPLQGAANTGITVWFLGVEQLKQWNTVTDGTGNYCINVGIGPYQGDASDPRGFPISYLITSSTDINQPGTMCDPLPPQCRTCDPMYATWSYPPCNSCLIVKPGAAGYVPDGEVVLARYPDCSPPTPEAFINRCHFCPGTAPSQCDNLKYDFNTGANTTSPSAAISGGCYQLQDLAMRAPGCNCIALNDTCQTGKNCCPGPAGETTVCNEQNRCVLCTKHRGDVCAATDGCCPLPPDTQGLTCADNICVPDTDPSFVE